MYTTKKNIFKKPTIIQIIPQGPKDTFQIDIMEIPKLLQSDDNCKYILTIIDQFSKFGNAYILSNKKADGVLGHVKEFIFINGKCNKIHTDNGKEFCNSLFNKYCIDNGINHICGRPYHPQSQGCVESFNKEAKRLLETKYLEDPKNFNIYTVLPDIVNIYNNNIHSTTKYKPSFLFRCEDNSIIERVILNIKKSQKKFKDKINGIKPGAKCLISENCKIKNKNIFANKLKKKANILFLVLF